MDEISVVQRLIKVLKGSKGVTPLRFQQLTDPLYPDFDWEERFELLKLQGLPLLLRKGKIYLKTAITPYREGEYCVVDLEVTDSRPGKGQIIEIGAVLIERGEITEEFSSLIYAPEIPDYISKITGIDRQMVEGASSQREVLEKFRLFLGDRVFCSHPASFDYTYLGEQFRREGLGELLNRHLCTLKLAQLTLEAPRYGLKYLQKEFQLPEEQLHRGLGDARTTARIFLKSWEKLPGWVQSVEDLIEFAGSGVQLSPPRKSNTSAPEE
jgi:DNA polymerase-3 subunit epsilon